MSKLWDIYHHVFSNAKCHFKVGVCIYFHAYFHRWEKSFQRRGIYVTSCVLRYESHSKAVVLTYHRLVLKGRSHF